MADMKTETSQVANFTKGEIYSVDLSYSTYQPSIKVNGMGNQSTEIRFGTKEDLDNFMATLIHSYMTVDRKNQYASSYGYIGDAEHKVPLERLQMWKDCFERDGDIKAALQALEPVDE